MRPFLNSNEFIMLSFYDENLLKSIKDKISNFLDRDNERPLVKKFLEEELWKDINESLDALADIYLIWRNSNKLEKEFISNMKVFWLKVNNELLAYREDLLSNMSLYYQEINNILENNIVGDFFVWDIKSLGDIRMCFYIWWLYFMYWKWELIWFQDENLFFYLASKISVESWYPYIEVLLRTIEIELLKWNIEIANSNIEFLSERFKDIKNGKNIYGISDNLENWLIYLKWYSILLKTWDFSFLYENLYRINPWSSYLISAQIYDFLLKNRDKIKKEFFESYIKIPKSIVKDTKQFEVFKNLPSFNE